MGGKPLSGCRILAIFPRTWASRNWTKDKVEGWIKSAGGALQKDFDERNTTHLVVEEQAWKNKVRFVQLALEANDNGGKVHIVSPEWLDTCLVEQRKCRERTYLWEKLDQEASGGKQKKRGKQSGEGEEGAEDGEGASKSHQAMLGDVLQEGTEVYVGDHDRRAWEAEQAGIEKARKEAEEAEARRKEEEKKATEQQRKARADIMKKSVKKGRGEVFNANYHPFKDSTGFAYDVMLTKVDTLTNSNERLNLTLYESNAGVPDTDNPPTYATNLHFAGTGKRPINNILAAMDSSYYTAMRMYRKAFMEKTGVDWDDRIKAHNDRVRERARDVNTPGLHSIRRGENGDIKSKTRAAEDETPFEKRKFEYMPPLHAAKGWLPDGKESMPEVLRQIRAKPSEQRDRTEQWTMRGGNVSGPATLQQSPRQSIEESRFNTQIDLTEDDAADQDISATMDSGNDIDGYMTGADFDAINGAEAVAGDIFSNGPNADTLDMNGLLADEHGWSTQDNMFDAGDLTGQHQEHFVFDQEHTNFSIEQFGTGIEALDLPTTNMDVGGMNAYDDSFDASLPGQTQFATMVGEDLLGGDHLGGAGLDVAVNKSPCETAVNGLVLVPEAEQLEAAAGVEKRKRGEEDTEMEPAAKRFESEEFAT